ncbi:hypothetical protein C0993_002916, partial [Termitomyces sp. T159_Od127]
MPGASSGGQAKPPGPRCVTRQSAQETKVNSLNKAKEWLSVGGFITAPSSPIDMETLKTVVMQLARNMDIPADTHKGMQAVAFSLKGMVVKETGGVVMDTVEKAMEGYKEMLEALAETSVQMHAEHADIKEQVQNKARQVIIDFPADSTTTKDLTERELVTKANIAKELMGIAGLDAPK